MAWKAAEAIELSENQKSILEYFAKSTHEPLHIKKRVRIILDAAEGKSNNKISLKIGIKRAQVRLWRER